MWWVSQSAQSTELRRPAVIALTRSHGHPLQVVSTICLIRTCNRHESWLTPVESNPDVWLDSSQTRVNSSAPTHTCQTQFTIGIADRYHGRWLSSTTDPDSCRPLQLCITKHAPDIELRVTDASVRSLWTATKVKAVLLCLGFQQIGSLLNFSSVPATRWWSGLWWPTGVTKCTQLRVRNYAKLGCEVQS